MLLLVVKDAEFGSPVGLVLLLPKIEFVAAMIYQAGFAVTDHQYTHNPPISRIFSLFYGCM